MSAEKFNSKYRTFAKAAKEAGFDKDERKLIALEPPLIMEGTSEQLKESLTPQILQSLFESLEKEHTDVTARHVLDIGNFLYSYRSDNGHGEENKMSEKDHQLANLACRLVENSFYAGNLENLGDTHAAALAFTVNVLAKILEQSNEQHFGFDREKLERFISNVHTYEQQTLFPNPTQNEGMSAREQTVKKIEEIAKRTLGEAEDVSSTVEWDEYFANLFNSYDTAMNIAHDAEMSRSYNDDMEEVGRVIKKHGAHVGTLLKKLASDIRAPLETHKVLDPSAVEPLYRSLVDTIFAMEHRNASVGDRERSLQIRRNAKESYEAFVRKVEKSRAEKTEQVAFNDFRTLADDLTKRKAVEKLPEAISIFRRIFEKKPDGPLEQYLVLLRRAAYCLERRDTISDTDDKFMAAERRLHLRTDNPSTTAYVIKSCLIANSMIRRSGGVRYEAENENELARLQYLFNNRQGGQGNPTHPFIIDVNYQDRKSPAIPAYSNLHFMPEDMPFAVWARRYLRSRH